ncbi:hypothetical protein N0Y54_30580 [Nostoc punctiforme UO1]|uniref:hypothetical protein n=1 Tax=Nostoc punctiforme TaxID=272131 RepID=UPI0030A1D768
MSVSKQPHLSIENQILAAMTTAEYEGLAPHLEQVQLEVGQVLYKANEPITHVYFPHQSIVSLVSIQKDGSTVEAGIVGNDGIVIYPWLTVFPIPQLSLGFSKLQSIND